MNIFTADSLVHSVNLFSNKSMQSGCLIQIIYLLKDLINKMTATPKKRSSFPWKKGSIILLLLIGTVVAFDCRKHGSFEGESTFVFGLCVDCWLKNTIYYFSKYLFNDILIASSTGRLLKTSGVIGHGLKGWSTIKQYSNDGLAYLEASSPEYYKYASDLTKQYSKLAGDFYLVGRNIAIRVYNNTLVYVNEKRPIVLQSVSIKFQSLNVWKEVQYLIYYWY